MTQIDRRDALALTGIGLAGLASPALASAKAAPPWNELAAKLGDRLRAVASPLETCVKAGGAGGDELFARTLKNPYAISDDPGLTQTLSWSRAWRSGTPTRVVVARDAGDISTAIAFAKRHRVRLVTRGGAHSYFGNSNGAGSLLVWTRAMREVIQHDAFAPSGGPAGSPSEAAVSVSAGALWGDVYRQTMVDAGRYVQGGGCLTVGVAGFTLGGGFGSLSKRFGTGAANLLEAEIVTADGKVRIANPWRDPELFFALRGGGGGTFGIVTRLTLRTHTLPETIGAALFEVVARDDTAWRALVAEIIDHYATHLFNPQWGEQLRFSPGRRLGVSMLAAGRSQDEVRADWAPFLAWVRERGADYTLPREPALIAAPARQFWNPQFLNSLPGIVMSDDRPGADPNHVYWNDNRGEAGQQVHAYKSRWLPQSLLEPANRTRLADALIAGSARWPVALHTNKGLAGGDATALARTAQTATNPQVSDAFALLIVAATDDPAWPGIPGHEPDTADAIKQAASVGEAFAPLAAVSPGMGCYMSESDWWNPDFARDYWGANYPRLLAAKRKYDPAGLFGGHNCVGSV